MDTRLDVEYFEEKFRLVTEAANVVHEKMRTAVRDTTSGMVKAIGGAPQGLSTHEPRTATRTLEFDEMDV